jgi:hypothetical protein
LKGEEEKGHRRDKKSMREEFNCRGYTSRASGGRSAASAQDATGPDQRHYAGKYGGDGDDKAQLGQSGNARHLPKLNGDIEGAPEIGHLVFKETASEWEYAADDLQKMRRGIQKWGKVKQHGTRRDDGEVDEMVQAEGVASAV